METPPIGAAIDFWVDCERRFADRDVVIISSHIQLLLRQLLFLQIGLHSSKRATLDPRLCVVWTRAVRHGSILWLKNATQFRQELDILTCSASWSSRMTLNIPTLFAAVAAWRIDFVS